MTSSNPRNNVVDNYEGNVAPRNIVSAKQNIGNMGVVGNMMQRNDATGVRCYNCRQNGQKEKTLLCEKQVVGVPLSAEEYNFLTDTDGEEGDRDLNANFIFMTKLNEVIS
ncbi:hypothetical protein Tco_1381051 [Tanacetum coccineum]